LENNLKWVEAARKKLNDKNLPLSTLSLIINSIHQVGISEFYNLEKTKEKELNELLELVLKKKEPVAYIVGFEIFYGYKIKVNKNVLIPRVETEMLVFEVIKYIRNNFEKGSTIRIADICTGSGAILIVISKELSGEYNLELIASDISNVALDVAKKNFNDYNLDVNIYCDNLIKPLIENEIAVDIIVSNPPYIGASNFVEEMVVTTEPKLALFGGVEGHEIYYEFFKQLKDYDKPIKIFWEIGFDQQNVLEEKSLEYKVENFRCEKDLFGRDRIISFDWR